MFVPANAFQSVVSKRLMDSLKVESGTPCPALAHDRDIG